MRHSLLLVETVFRRRCNTGEELYEPVRLRFRGGERMPRKPIGFKKKQVPIVVEEELRNAVMREAARNLRSFSQQVEFEIARYIREVYQSGHQGEEVES
jgi:hypothetical protein